MDFVTLSRGNNVFNEAGQGGTCPPTGSERPIWRFAFERSADLSYPIAVLSVF